MTNTLSLEDPRLGWYGAISLERDDGSIKPWRLPFEDLVLFGKLDPPDALLVRAGMPAGVRLAFHSDTRSLGGEIKPLPDDAYALEPARNARMDLVCDGELHQSLPLHNDTSFQFEELPAGQKLIELWLPHYREFRLCSLQIDDRASVQPYEDSRPEWLVYGSSNTQCRGAASPTRTWPAIVSRRVGLNPTNLGFGGQCHLDPMVARMMSSMDVDFITLEVGINIYIEASLSLRTFRSSLIGFLQILRDGHPQVPIAIMSSFYSPGRETTPNAVGFTLAAMRDEIATAVADLRTHGDERLHYVDGLEIFGEDLAHLLPDQLHPNAEGNQIIGDRFAERVAQRLLGRLSVS
jgi:lysophospholipase L1-like esterase